MNRLTKICEIHDNKPLSYSSDISKYPDMMGYEYEQVEMDIVNKLGQLEDIEEELGCSLKIVFKAMKNGILVDNKTRWYTTVSLVNVKLDNNYYFSIGDYPLYKLKDYRKTWWLAEDLGE